MATPPVFSAGAVLTAAQMNAVGLWLVKTQTVGSAVGSQSVTNAFTSDFDNYLVTMAGGTASAASSVGIQLGSSTTGYYGFLVYGDVTGVVQGGGRNNTSLMSWVGGCQGANQAVFASVQVMGPQKAAYTRFANGIYQNGGNWGTLQGEHRVATAYTDFTLTMETGTMTGGTIRVYGYRN